MLASPCHVPGFPFPNPALCNPGVAKISKPWCAMVFRGVTSLIITFPPFPLFLWGKLNKRTQAWSTRRRSWRVTSPRCRMKWRNRSRSAGMQRKKQRKPSQMWVDWFLAHFFSVLQCLRTAKKVIPRLPFLCLLQNSHPKHPTGVWR